jgi:hypothetical protein
LTKEKKWGIVGNQASPTAMPWQADLEVKQKAKCKMQNWGRRIKNNRFFKVTTD